MVSSQRSFGSGSRGISCAPAEATLRERKHQRVPAQRIAVTSQLPPPPPTAVAPAAAAAASLSRAPGLAIVRSQPVDGSIAPLAHNNFFAVFCAARRKFRLLAFFRV